jgi:hypothetical protein
MIWQRKSRGEISLSDLVRGRAGKIYHGPMFPHDLVRLGSIRSDSICSSVQRFRAPQCLFSPCKDRQRSSLGHPEVCYSPICSRFEYKCSQGIGAACAIALAEAGASVCLIQRTPASGGTPNLDTLNTIRALGVTAEVVYCDLSDLRAVRDVFQIALDVMGGNIHVLVNCAGIQRRSPSVEFSEGDWDDVRLYIPCSLFS